MWLLYRKENRKFQNCLPLKIWLKVYHIYHSPFISLLVLGLETRCSDERVAYIYLKANYSLFSASIYGECEIETKKRLLIKCLNNKYLSTCGLKYFRFWEVHLRLFFLDASLVTGSWCRTIKTVLSYLYYFILVIYFWPLLCPNWKKRKELVFDRFNYCIVL